MFYFELDHLNRQGDTIVTEIYAIKMTVKMSSF